MIKIKVNKAKIKINKVKIKIKKTWNNMVLKSHPQYKITKKIKILVKIAKEI